VLPYFDGNPAPTGVRRERPPPRRSGARRAVERPEKLAARAGARREYPAPASRPVCAVRVVGDRGVEGRAAVGRQAGVPPTPTNWAGARMNARAWERGRPDGTAAHPPAATKAQIRSRRYFWSRCKGFVRAGFRTGNTEKTIRGGAASGETTAAGRERLLGQRHGEAPAHPTNARCDTACVRDVAVVGIGAGGSLRPGGPQPPVPARPPFLSSADGPMIAPCSIAPSVLPGLYVCAGPPAGGAISASGGRSAERGSDAQRRSRHPLRRLTWPRVADQVRRRDREAGDGDGRRRTRRHHAQDRRG
jgi:hypothetical protein